MEFRKYEEKDAQEIIKWISNEREFRLWSADRYDKYPVSEEDINNNYHESEKISKFYPMTMVENGNIVGHMIIRYPSNEKNAVRFGFIIVNSKIRGKGYGKKLILEGIKYAIEILRCDEISLGVFDINENALMCYKSVGFYKVDEIKNAYQYNDENWNQIEMILKK